MVTQPIGATGAYIGLPQYFYLYILAFLANPAIIDLVSSLIMKVECLKGFLYFGIFAANCSLRWRVYIDELL
jgi:hypothetical protein